MKNTRDVLIVDDDDAIRNLLKITLTRAGLACDTASDGVHAVEQLQLHDYLVVLLDLMMPRLDGVGVVQQISKDEHAANRPVVIMVTASADRSPLLPVAEHVQVVIKKPFDLTYLAELVTDCALTRRTPQAPVRRAISSTADRLPRR